MSLRTSLSDASGSGPSSDTAFSQAPAAHTSNSWEVKWMLLATGLLLSEGEKSYITKLFTMESNADFSTERKTEAHRETQPHSGAVTWHLPRAPSVPAHEHSCLPHQHQHTQPVLSSNPILNTAKVMLGLPSANAPNQHLVFLTAVLDRTTVRLTDCSSTAQGITSRV